MIDPDFEYESVLSPITEALKGSVLLHSSQLTECPADNSMNLDSYESIVRRARVLVDKILNELIKRKCDILEISDFLRNTLLLSSSRFSYFIIRETRLCFRMLADQQNKSSFTFSTEPTVIADILTCMNPKYTKNLSVDLTRNSRECSNLMDAVTLKYSAEFPENLFLTDEILGKYTGLFSFIWRVVRLRDTLVKRIRQKLRLLMLMGSVDANGKGLFHASPQKLKPPRRGSAVSPPRPGNYAQDVLLLDYAPGICAHTLPPARLERVRAQY